MNEAIWFSSMLNFVVIEGDSEASRQRSLVLFRAQTFEDAADRALSLGHAMEKDYVGGTGSRVRWLLERLETIDQLGPDLVDGREIYAEPSEAFPLADLTFPLAPELSHPENSGV